MCIKFMWVFKMNILYKPLLLKCIFIMSIVFFTLLFHSNNNVNLFSLLSFTSAAHAVPPPRGASKGPMERNRKARAEKIKREKARRDSINCYIRERKKLDDGGLTCIYKCPKGRTESNSIGAGFRCPTMMNVLRRE